MPRRVPPTVWPTRLLAWLCYGVSAGLLGLVVVSPWVAAESFPVLELFARDTTVRRTAVACAVALWVTARTFFRVPVVPSPPVKTRISSTAKPPASTGGVVGA